MSSFCSSGSNYFSAVAGTHSLSETMYLRSGSLFWLKCHLHDSGTSFAINCIKIDFIYFIKNITPHYIGSSPFRQAKYLFFILRNYTHILIHQKTFFQCYPHIVDEMWINIWNFQILSTRCSNFPFIFQHFQM